MEGGRVSSSMALLLVTIAWKTFKPFHYFQRTSRFSRLQLESWSDTRVALTFEPAEPHTASASAAPDISTRAGARSKRVAVPSLARWHLPERRHTGTNSVRTFKFRGFAHVEVDVTYVGAGGWRRDVHRLHCRRAAHTTDTATAGVITHVYVRSRGWAGQIMPASPLQTLVASAKWRHLTRRAMSARPWGAMAYRPHAALAPRATAAAAAAARPQLVTRARRAPAGRSLALRVEMRAEGGRLKRVEGGGWRRVEEEEGRRWRRVQENGPGQEGGGEGGPEQEQIRGRYEAPWGGDRGGRGDSGGGSPTRRDPAAPVTAPGSTTFSNEQLNLNRSISGASCLDDILDLVEEHHDAFHDINIATAVTSIAKRAKEQRSFGRSNAVTPLAREGERHAAARMRRHQALASDERYATLTRLVADQLRTLEARQVTSVFYGLTTLQRECCVKADPDLLVQLGAAMERVAPDMNAEEIANTLNTYSKLEKAAAEMPRSLRRALAGAVERLAPDMTAKHVANTLYAYSKLEEAAAEMPRSLWGALAEAAERVAPDMTARHVTNTLDAYRKLVNAEEEMPPTLRKALAEAAAREAPKMSIVQSRISRRACALLKVGI